MRIQIAFGALTILAALAAPANAAGDIAGELGLPAPEARILGARLQVCNTCHGDNGGPKMQPFRSSGASRKAISRRSCMTSGVEIAPTR